MKRDERYYWDLPLYVHVFLMIILVCVASKACTWAGI